MTGNKVISRKGKEIRCNIPLLPGDIIMDELEARDIKKSIFAEQLRMKPSHFRELLRGKRNVNAATAIKLEDLLSIKAEYWLRVQAYSDLFMERNKQMSLA